MAENVQILKEVIGRMKDILRSLDDTLSFDYGWMDIHWNYKLGVNKDGVRAVFSISRELATDSDRERKRIKLAKCFLRHSFYLQKV